MSGAPVAVRFDGVSKAFPGVQALRDVTFEVRAGACHAWCGENGAGKSTLAKVLAGVQAHDSGRLWLDGVERRFRGPREALLAGVALVHQELALCPNLSVAENLCLGALPARGAFVSRAETRRRARRLLGDVGVALDVDARLGGLSPGQRQLVQIAAACGGGARVILFDEPTSSLSEVEAQQLEALVRRLLAQGVTCIYVSHRMREIFRLCDTVTVLRDGRHVVTRPLQGLDEGALVRLMIGREVGEHSPQHLRAEPGAELLRVERLSSPGRFHDVSFALRAGEVLGLAGLVGAGRSELAQALFGLDPQARGEVFVDGAPLRLAGPREALGRGVGLVPEERQRQGLVLGQSGRANATLPILPRLSRLRFVRRAQERALVGEYFGRLRVRGAPEAPVAGLSGGNQQKIVLARWLLARSRVLILDEPTRGVDVGAKAEIHALIDELAASGKAVLLISSELPELLRLSTRVLVLRAGRVAGELARAEAGEESVLRLMSGVRAA